MKAIKFITLPFVICFAFFISGCGSGGDDSTSQTGSISMSVTDAKPLLPDNITNLFVEFTDIRVHKAEGGWIQLALSESPYTIDLLQFQDGSTTQIVPPTELDAGKYTQVRIVVASARLRLHDDPATDQWVDIPSQNLRTDQNFTLNIAGGTAIDMVIHFDLSKSLVVTGTGEYQLKPVLHLFKDPLLAATINGSIDNDSFGDSEKATISVSTESDEIFTEVEVEESETLTSTPFRIFWIAPEQTYTVEIDLDQDGVVDCSEVVDYVDLPQGAAFELNSGADIVAGFGICAP